MSKACTKCKVERELSEYTKDISLKSGLKSQCKSCVKEYCDASKARVAATSKAWYEDNKDRKAATVKAWQEANKEKVAAIGKAWYEENKERHAANGKAWNAANPEAKANHKNTRRARMAGNGGNLTTSEWLTIKASWLNRCSSCGTKDNIALDHKISIHMGGKHSADNVQPLCGSCNSSKGAKCYSFLRSSILQRKIK